MDAINLFIVKSDAQNKPKCIEIVEADGYQTCFIALKMKNYGGPILVTINKSMPNPCIYFIKPQVTNHDLVVSLVIVSFLFILMFIIIAFVFFFYKKKGRLPSAFQKVIRTKQVPPGNCLDQGQA